MGTPTGIAEMSNDAPQKKTNIRPIGDRIIVRRDDAVGKTTGGIILPDTSKGKPHRGTVLAVGPGKLLDNGSRLPMDIDVDDDVVFGSYSGTDIEVGDSTFVVMNQGDILVVVEPASE